MEEKPVPIIQLQSITKKFPGVTALEGVSLDVHPGEIHAIIGENGAGKSTLMNILAGELQPDEGAILVDGKRCPIPDPLASRLLGISLVFQELALCPNLSIEENISLWRASGKAPWSLVDRKQFRQTAEAALAQLGLTDVDLRQPVGQLSVARQQMVEIAKAISSNARVLILDEPNSALTQEESEHLFTVARRLRDAGVAILYISHHLEEVLALADRITVLRDGRLVDTLPVGNATVGNLIARMVGRNIAAQERQFTQKEEGQAALEVVGLGSENSFQAITFQVHAGEIVGVAGLPDSHKDELVDGLFGLRTCCCGEIRIGGQAARIHGPQDAIQRGMFLIPADRRGAGVLPVMSLQDNIIVSSLRAVNRAGFLQRKQIRQLAGRYFEQLDIRASGLNQQMANLSGGNQQKAILARGLATGPAVLVLHEPTRGIDVGAKAEIYRILQELAAQGAAVLVVSSELPELISQCDRILVMSAGRLAGAFSHAEANEEAIMACIMGHTLQPILQ